MSHVLIVDDNEQNLYILQILLEGSGHKATLACNGEEALERIKGTVPDLVITDLLMPVMDGFALCRELKRIEDFRHIPVMVYTATYTEPEDQKLAQSLGADYFVIKPTEPVRLMEKIGEILAAGAPEAAEEKAESRNGAAVEREYRKRVAIKLEKKLGELQSEIKGRKRLEVELKESEEQYRCIFESVAEGLLILDDTGKIVELNPAACRMYGYQRSEALGLVWHDIADADSAQRLFEFFEHPDGAIFTESGEHTTHDLSSMAVEVRGVMFTYKGRPHFLAAIDDVSEQRQLEEQLRHSQKMEAVGRLAGGIAHDFNNLLQAILGNADLMMVSLPDDSEFREEVSEITAAAERATSLASQLLAFSRNQQLNRLDIAFNTVTSSLIKILQRLIGEDIEVETHFDPDIGTVHADPGQMEQVVMNLCVNARDAMPDGGRLTIETISINIDAESIAAYPWAKVGPYVCLKIGDTGCGMDAPTLERAFEPFFTTKGPEQGTGLGLATAYGIVCQHDGMIVADSTLGEGTTVSVFLPAIDRPVANLKISKEETQKYHGEETILVAEDDEAVCKLAKRILGEAGYTVICAVDGEQAWKMFTGYEGRIDLVMLDLVMPKLSGKEVRRRIEAQDETVHFLFTSGHSFDRYNVEDLDDISLILKPYRAAAILKAVREVLDGGEPV